eukprot:Skav213679  [mRNA]  locus=scaffold491:349772:351352:+ [translate_table: standard]
MGDKKSASDSEVAGSTLSSLRRFSQASYFSVSLRMESMVDKLIVEFFCIGNRSRQVLHLCIAASLVA